MTDNTDGSEKAFEYPDLLNQLPIGFFIIDHDFTVRFWNGTVEKWFAISADEILHRSIDVFFPGFKRLKTTEYLTPVFETGSPLILSHQFHKKLFYRESQDERFFNVLVKAIKAETGDYHNAVFTLQDISDLVYQIEQNRKMHAQALQEIEHRKQTEKQLESISNTDHLTGLSNRRDMVNKIDKESERSKRTGRPICIAIGDIDNFKKVNDNFGHDCGDFVLVDIATRLNMHLRTGDSIARWGGEEFLLMLPETDLEQGRRSIERIRESIAAESVVYEEREHYITMTFGLGCFVNPEIQTIDAVMTAADKALIRGKKEGKNRVVVSDGKAAE